MPTSKATPEYIDTHDKLITACKRLASANVLCVDTEFHRENTFYPRFALMQVSSDNDCFIIDPMAIQEMSPFWEVLHQPDKFKVFHAPRQDIEIILRESGRIPKPLFDTQTAASLLGYGLQIGFGNLVQRLLNKTLAKQESFSDWLARPLRPEQLTYAADDVLYLLPIYQQLKQELEAAGRLDWLIEEQAPLCDITTYETAPEEMFWRVKGANKLKPQGLAVLRALTAWREKKAQSEDTPRRRILADEVLVELARQVKGESLTFERMRNIRGNAIRKYGHDIQSAWQAGKACPSEQWPRSRPQPNHSAGTELRKEMLSTLVKLRADEKNIAACILANKSDLSMLASWGRKTDASPPDVACLHGWRHELVGEELIRLLKGEICLCIDSSTKLPAIERKT